MRTFSQLCSIKTVSAKIYGKNFGLLTLNDFKCKPENTLFHFTKKSILKYLGYDGSITLQEQRRPLNYDDTKLLVIQKMPPEKCITTLTSCSALGKFQGKSPMFGLY